MKSLRYLVLLMTIVLCQSFVRAQAVADPAYMPVYQTSAAINVDGKLDEAVWSKDLPHLKFNAGALPSGNDYTPTGGVVVKPVYKDTSTCYVYFLRSGMKLYIALKSNDKQVCRFGDSWEGDGIFMKIKNAAGTDVEYKLYYNLAGANPEIHYEGPAHSSGAGVKGTGTTVNDSSNVDAGYTAELMISLDSLGYTASNVDTVKVLINIFDPDNYNDGVGAWGGNGNFYKQWWGSEWGPDMRKLVMKNMSADSFDPAFIPVYQTNVPVTIDGNLDESIWKADVPRLKFKLGGMPSGNEYTPTGGVVVKPVYKDTSSCTVRFVRDGMKLYLALQSDDKQVCRFGDSWEGDGIFMKIKNAAGGDVEYKLYYNLAGVNPDIHYEGPSHSSGAAKKGTGTTVNDSTNVDGGFTAELMIRLDSLGFTAANVDTMKVLINIFDPDNYSDGVGAWGNNGNYYKQWWGSEWGPDMRKLILKKDVATAALIDPAKIDVFQTNVPITVDGNLNESIWNADLPRMNFRLNGVPAGNVFAPTGSAVVKPPYKDTSNCMVRFVRDGMKLYIALKSDDKQVCRFGDSWEGDGIFMKVKNKATNADVEYKLYYNLAGANPDIHYEGPTHGIGAAKKGAGTVVNDSTNVDGGFTAELLIRLDSLGYTNSVDTVKVLINIFDPDNYSDGVGAWGNNGSYAKQWWGSEWGPDMRSLILKKDIPAAALIDPLSLPVYQTSKPITVDGALDETPWTIDVPKLKFRINGVPSGNDFAPTGFAEVKPFYKDTSTCTVRFLHDGLKLYISLKSDDKQVCRFGDSWEGDGIFMKIKNKATNADVEYKLYYNLAGANPDMHYEGPTHSKGVGKKGTGTTVNDSTNVDGGYTAELQISLDSLGYTANADSIKVMMNIFDPDNYSDGVGAWGNNGNYAKQWWGSEWGPEMRTLILTNTIVDVKNELTTLPTAFKLNQNYPNPFNPSTTISFDLAENSNVTLSVYNVLGQLVKVVTEGSLTAGAHKYNFNASNLSSGVYLYSIKAKSVSGKEFTASHKMILMK